MKIRTGRAILFDSAKYNLAGVSGDKASFFLRLAVISTIVVFFALNPYQKPLVNLALGATVIVIALLPFDFWLRSKKGYKIPIVELHLVFYAIFWGFAAFIDPPELFAQKLRVNEQSYTVGLFAALLGIVFLLAGYYVSQVFKSAILGVLVPKFPVRADKVAIVFLYPLSLVASLLVRHFEIGALEQIVPAVRLFSFTWVLCAVLSNRVRGPVLLFAMLFVVPVELLIYANFLISGFLFDLLTYGELIIVCFAVFRGRILLGLVLAGFMVFAILTPVKNQFRSIIWKQDTSMSLSERAEIASNAVYNSTQDTIVDESVAESLRQSFGRLHHLADGSAAIQAAMESDYLFRGETYAPLLTKWIPRALWPDKPVEDLGNRWARQFGFLDASNYTTSFNLPWLPEMFLNFGWAGIIGMSFILGWFIGLFENGVVAQARSPVEVAFAFSLASLFFFPESNLSVTLGGVVVRWITISVLLISMRSFLRFR